MKDPGAPAGGGGAAKAIYVLTGGPCAGKTTLLEELRRLGHPAIAEVATQVIREGKLHPSRQPLEFQREVLRRQIEAEAAAPPGPVFADRGIGDHFAYLEYYRARRGLETPRAMMEEFEGCWKEALLRYPAVLLLEQHPRLPKDEIRRESPGDARFIHQAIAAAYRLRHPRVIEVPWLPLAERVRRALEAAGL